MARAWRTLGLTVWSTAPAKTASRSIIINQRKTVNGRCDVSSVRHQRPLCVNNATRQWRANGAAVVVVIVARGQVMVKPTIHRPDVTSHFTLRLSVRPRSIHFRSRGTWSHPIDFRCNSDMNILLTIACRRRSCDLFVAGFAVIRRE